MDVRCLHHDHHFNDEDLYDSDYEGMPVPLPREVQLAARCTRPDCGMTMEQSLQAIIAECRQLIDHKTN